MLLSSTDLHQRLSTGSLGVAPLAEDAIGPASIDLHLSPVLRRYSAQVIELGRTVPDYEELLIPDTGFDLPPGDFVLGMTLERVQIPTDLHGTIETKGDIARAGLRVHANDGHVDAGTDGHITLEIINQHHRDVIVRLRPGVAICQLFLSVLSSETDRPYRGKYSHQRVPTTYLP
jgi:dCTP deaminase